MAKGRSAGRLTLPRTARPQQFALAGGSGLHLTSLLFITPFRCPLVCWSASLGRSQRLVSKGTKNGPVHSWSMVKGREKTFRATR